VGGATVLLFWPSARPPSYTGGAGPASIVGPFGWSFLFQSTPPPATTLDFRRALVASLLGSADLAAIVGTQVWPMRVPEDKKPPALLYQVLRLPRQHTLDGPVGLAEASVRLAVGSRAFADTVSAAAVLRDLYDGFQGTLSGVEVEEAELEDEQDLYDPPIDAGDRGTFWTLLTFTFRFTEAFVL
jgi:Protein of unknown function (DUF3168)